MEKHVVSRRYLLCKVLRSGMEVRGISDGEAGGVIGAALRICEEHILQLASPLSKTSTFSLSTSTIGSFLFYRRFVRIRFIYFLIELTE